MSASGSGEIITFKIEDYITLTPEGNGNKTITPVELHPIFINEAAYQSSDIAFSIMKKKRIIVY